jgi:hypothetical protein
MSIQEFDKATVHTLITDMEAALQSVADKHGIILKRKNCSYRSNVCAVPFEVCVERVTADGNVETPESATYKARCFQFGLKPEWLFEWFTDFLGKRLQVVGLKPRRRKYPVVVRAENGTQYKMAAAQVQRHMEVK